jgi:Tfp pilus assembly protein FimT
MATMGELAVVLGLVATATATALPELQAGLDDARVAGAARYVSSRLVEARLDAISRAREVAIRFSIANGHYSYTVYVDGNHNGVLARDIQRGIDRPIRGPETLSANFRNAEFGVQPGLPAIDSGSEPPGNDPIRLGVSNSVSFGSLGTATSGTIYLTGRSRAQYAVRVFGATGKIRVYRFERRSGKWMPS